MFAGLSRKNRCTPVVGNWNEWCWLIFTTQKKPLTKTVTTENPRAKVAPVSQKQKEATHKRSGPDLRCVGINRRGVVNERVIQERRSETILASSHAGAVVRSHSKRSTKVYVGWV